MISGSPEDVVGLGFGRGVGEGAGGGVEPSPTEDFGSGDRAGGAESGEATLAGASEQAAIMMVAAHMAASKEGNFGIGIAEAREYIAAAKPSLLRGADGSGVL